MKNAVLILLLMSLLPVTPAFVLPALGGINVTNKKMQPVLEPFAVDLKVLDPTQKKGGWHVPVELTFENKGKQAIDLDKFSIGFDGDLKSDLFKISDGEKSVPYIGMAVRRAPPGRKGFVLLKPGEILKTRVELGKKYRFPGNGGTFTIKYESANAFSKDRFSLVSDTVTFTLMQSQ